MEQESLRRRRKHRICRSRSRSQEGARQTKRANLCPGEYYLELPPSIVLKSGLIYAEEGGQVKVILQRRPREQKTGVEKRSLPKDSELKYFAEPMTRWKKVLADKEHVEDTRRLLPQPVSGLRLQSLLKKA